LHIPSDSYGNAVPGCFHAGGAGPGCMDDLVVDRSAVDVAGSSRLDFRSYTTFGRRIRPEITSVISIG